MDVFKQLENDFSKLSFIAVDDPYQTVCEYYYDYISDINRVVGHPQHKYSLSNIVSSLELIKKKLNEGLATCHIWDRSAGNSHFMEVHTTIQNLKKSYQLDNEEQN